jgi:hypothetical protein
MFKHGAKMKWAACFSIIAVAVITYLPAVDNFFISDDFVLLTFLETLNERPHYLLEWPSEMFRLMSYIYFWVCFQFFAINPVPYYLSGIALHAIVSLLVCAVVLKFTGRWLAAWAAGLFFAGYERHQEAVMWISAANDTILALNFLIALLLWWRYVAHAAHSRAKTLALGTALAAFAVALFSKEGAVALAPLAFVGFVISGSGWRTAIRRSLPLLIMTVGFGVLWLSQSGENFFVTKGLYAFGPHFLPVFGRSLLRLVLPTLVFLVPLIIVIRREKSDDRPGPIRRWLKESGRVPALLFFLALLAFSIIPYSFLTYQNHIPSRNTYLPSVGLAALAGILFMALYEKTSSSWGRRASAGLLLAVVAANASYVWTKKEPQFRERSAPTLELIKTLNDSALDIQNRSPITICGFPLDTWIGWETVLRFTPVEAKDVVFKDVCDDSVASALRWDESQGGYSMTFQAKASAQIKE